MKVSELISRLQSILENKGDYQVEVEMGGGHLKPLDYVTTEEIEGNIFVIIKHE